MNIAVTGANGFIGRSLCDRLSKENNIMRLKIRKNTDFVNLKEKVVSFNPDVFIHCGWSGGNSFSTIDSSEQFNNIYTGLEILKMISDINNLHFVALGSFSEYGDLKQQATEQTLEKPSSLYGVCKNIYKQISKTMCGYNNHKWLWIRPCFLYGPNDVQTRLIPKTIDACLSQDRLSLDSCKSVVDYLYIDDFVEAVCSLLEQQSVGCFNICSGEEYTVKDIVLQILQKTGEESVFFDPSKDREGFQKYICGDNKKLIDEIGWKQKHTIEAGIKKTIEFHKEQIRLIQYSKEYFLNMGH